MRASPVPPLGRDGATFATENSDSSNRGIARVIGMFAVVGLGLGVGTLFFLWITGAFESDGGLEDFGQAIFGSLAMAAVLVFGLMIGIVLAAVGALFVVSRSDSVGAAVTGAAIGGGVGHLALVLTLGAFLIVGIPLLTPGASSSADQLTPTIEPFPTFDLSDDVPPGVLNEDASCEETFGANSPICETEPPAPSPPAVAVEENDGGETLAIAKDVARLALGVVPAALVGALTAAVLFDRRRRRAS